MNLNLNHAMEKIWHALRGDPTPQDEAKLDGKLEPVVGDDGEPPPGLAIARDNGYGAQKRAQAQLERERVEALLKEGAEQEPVDQGLLNPIDWSDVDKATRQKIREEQVSHLPEI